MPIDTSRGYFIENVAHGADGLSVSVGIVFGPPVIGNKDLCYPHVVEPIEKAYEFWRKGSGKIAIIRYDTSKEIPWGTVWYRDAPVSYAVDTAPLHRILDEDVPRFLRELQMYDRRRNRAQKRARERAGLKMEDEMTILDDESNRRINANLNPPKPPLVRVDVRDALDRIEIMEPYPTRLVYHALAHDGQHFPVHVTHSY